MNKTLPIQKGDIQYNPETQEVTLKREKFDGLMKFVRDAMKELDETEEARDVAEFRARRSRASENIYETILDDLEQGSKAISRWVEKHNIQRLSDRSGIPYATCHRIVEQRLKKGSISIRLFGDLLRAVREEFMNPPKSSPAKCVLVGTMNYGSGKSDVAKKLGAVQIEYLTVGPDVKNAKAAKEKNPDIVILDRSAPKFKMADAFKVIGAVQDSPVLIVNSMSKAKLEESAEKVFLAAAGGLSEK